MNNQTVEKLYQMKLHTMAAAFKEQLDQPSMGSLSFEERIAMMVDREWLFRENRRLGRRLKAAKLKGLERPPVEDINFRHPRGLDKSVILDPVKLPMDKRPSQCDHHGTDRHR